MENLTDRLNYILELKGLSQSDLARLISVKPQVIQYLCTSNAKNSRFTFDIAQALEINPEWLATGKKPIFLSEDSKDAFIKDKILIPILDWKELFLLLKNSLVIDDSHELTLVPSKYKKCFGLSMSDNSMQPVFTTRTLLIIKPEQVPNINDYVLVYLTLENTFIIRKLIVIDGKSILLPLNTNLFKEVELMDEDKVIGKVMENRTTYE